MALTQHGDLMLMLACACMRRFLDLAPAMSPVALAEQAVDLNLRLMRWRAAPGLDTASVAATKCLLLGGWVGGLGGPLCTAKVPVRAAGVDVRLASPAECPVCPVCVIDMRKLGTRPTPATRSEGSRAQAHAHGHNPCRRRHSGLCGGAHAAGLGRAPRELCGRVARVLFKSRAPVAV